MPLHCTCFIAAFPPVLDCVNFHFGMEPLFGVAGIVTQHKRCLYTTISDGLSLLVI